jgi:hypothetical protein
MQTTPTVRNAPDQAGTPTPDSDRAAAPQSVPVAGARGTRQRPDNRARHPHVSWYGTLLIVLMLTIAAGWELWRLLLQALTLD